MPRKITELDKKIYKYVMSKGEQGVPQNVLWKELKISSRDASRSLKKLEELGYVKRESIVHGGRRTFRIIALKKRIREEGERPRSIPRPLIHVDGFSEIPCMYCPYIDMCYEGGYYDPTSCEWIYSWVREKVVKTS